MTSPFIKDGKSCQVESHQNTHPTLYTHAPGFSVVTQPHYGKASTPST